MYVCVALWVCAGVGVCAYVRVCAHILQNSDEEYRRVRRREQNRRAAQRCRARRKLKEVAITQVCHRSLLLSLRHAKGHYHSSMS